MPDYSKGKIYKLWSPSKNIVYYGSTCETLSRRLSKHLNDYKRYDGGKGYLYSFKVLECEDYKIELMEEYPCNNKQQLTKKEGEYIIANECVNDYIAGRTKKEWVEDNKQQAIEVRKKYKEEHKAELREKDKIYMKTEKAKEQHKLANKKYNETKKQNIAIYKWLLTAGLTT